MSTVNESVWFEQVDTALIERISNVVKLKNESGELVPVPVDVRKPDEDFKVESYPRITIYNLYSTRDEERYFPDKVVVLRDDESKTLVEEKGAIPYSLYYQIDFWSRLQSDMNEMTRMWLTSHPDKYFNLDVKDMAGKDRSSFVLLTDDLKKSDYFTGRDRTFHSYLTYRVWVELDERVQTEGAMIMEVPYPKTLTLEKGRR